ncbi:ergothioneine biosynthesis glutamate--cysteine ligase EgtA [Mycobacterium sp. MYCO198283]|uniref:ergothioneine biosynthesis glutamate--cysteine ligase EgtA n=1 Tax=Mycobacterium sp. MYCO198283 TaxID=2883505 RepID=UPI001E3D7A80|nr:ergothioneine biosynthesis glutamate--cysteine ligase EgtA [Mycobacterium sp. MYCO198283]MCG5432867.1 ergothioneine biosynthesis glutamate--cysteine ligase EgtA [Mycobacterium sp. MYCO198283]
MSPTTACPTPLRADDPLAGVEAAACHLAAGALVDGPVGRVGLEIEAHCFDLAEPRRRPTWRRIADVIDGLDKLPGGSVVTVEPGGAVELSGPPLAGALAAITAMAADRAVVRTAFVRQGLGLVLLGADPVRPPERVHPGARYTAMEQFFAATGTGAAGAAMMTSTASVQVNLDAGPRENWSRRVLLAHALGPVMVAITANSPMLGGAATGWRSTRQRVWGQLDTARCGPVLGRSDDPAGEWARYALKAPVMLVRTAAGATPVTARIPFVQWITGDVRLGGRRPTAADLDYHLTTLFPPVRPRRWLEIRYLDSVPDALWPAVVFAFVTLMDELPEVAADATEPVAAAWGTAARAGLADPALHTAAVRCLAAVADRTPSALHTSMQRLLDAVDRQRSPADDVTDRVQRSGIDATLVALAEEQP